MKINLSLLVMLALTACSARTLDGQVACTWPEAPQGCTVGSFLLYTSYGQYCASDDLDACPNDSASLAAVSTYVNECKPGEYAMICGVTTGQPPQSCRQALQSDNPGGESFDCCPCE